MPGLIDTFFNTEVMLRAVPMLARGLANTFYLAVTAMVLGTLAGVLICIARLYAPKPIRLIAIGFIDNLHLNPLSTQTVRVPAGASTSP